MISMRESHSEKTEERKGIRKKRDEKVDCRAVGRDVDSMEH